MKIPKILLLLIFFLCGFVLNLPAQNKDAAILVTVKDQFDAVIPNAKIILTESDEDKTKQAKTNEFGTAQISKLVAGEYQITVIAEGFKEYKSQNITVKTGETQRLEIRLEIAPIESVVPVGETNSDNPEKSGITTVLDKKQIDLLPDNQQELENTIKRIGESVVGDTASITVNGIQGGKIPPKQAIQQVRINQNVFSAQYENQYGGGIEIFTQSAVDKFSGYVGFDFADSRFNAADPFIGRRVPYQARSYYFDFSGPLGKKASFFAYGSRGESDSSSVINAVILNPNLQPTEFKQTFASPNRSESVDFTVNADPNKKHKLYFNYDFETGTGKGQNVGGFSLPTQAAKTDSQEHNFEFSETYLKNANTVSQTLFSLSYSKNKTFGANSGAAINVSDAFLGGGSQQNSSSKNFHFYIANETTRQIGKYNLGFGGRVRGEYINQNSTANFGGTYIFSGRLAPVLDASNNPATDGSGNIITTQISSLESYRRTLFFQQSGFSQQRIRELGGGADQFTISGGNPEIKVSQYDFSVYLQNSYKLNERLAASFGVRYERQTNVKSNFNLAPRLGLIWSPKEKKKQNPLSALPRITVGYGIFYTRFPLTDTLGIRQTDDTDSLQYLIADTNILDYYPDVPSVNLLQQFALPRTDRLIAKDFEIPYQSVFNVTAVKKMPSGYTLNFTFSREINRRQSVTRNINAPLAGTFNLLDPATAVRPFQGAGNIYQTESTRGTVKNRFSVFLNFPNSEKLYASVRYSFTKSKGNAVGTSGSPFDAYDFSREFAPGTYDGVYSIGGYFYYSLPFKVSVGGDFSIRSGTRFNIFTGRDTNGDGFFSERPSFANDLTKPNLVYTKYGILDPNPSPGDKIIPRNLGRGSKNIEFNSSISKSFGFNEDVKNKKPPKQTLRFNVRVNNVFNIINKSNPIGNMSSPNFLRTLSGGDQDSVFIYNGLRQINLVGRSFTFGVGFGF